MCCGASVSNLRRKMFLADVGHGGELFFYGDLLGSVEHPASMSARNTQREEISSYHH